METKASYMAVGGFLLAFILAAALFLLWLGRVELVNKQAFYNIYFKETVTGLKDG
ncbi:MAG: MCE family protein, partial [Alphaproteobacteria bacterium]|nr:MCE family protein [Alphaproteobacteria bacterium]